MGSWIRDKESACVTAQTPDPSAMGFFIYFLEAQKMATSHLQNREMGEGEERRKEGEGRKGEGRGREGKRRLEEQKLYVFLSHKLKPRRSAHKNMIRGSESLRYFLRLANTDIEFA